MPSSVRKIISGGQTGADRAALDFALTRGFEIGGYVPKGRVAEDGTIDEKYLNLIETETDDPVERTRLNVVHSDATLIVINGNLSGGTELTETFARASSKPVLTVNLVKETLNDAGITTKGWLNSIRPNVLNIAGPRTSEEPAIYDLTLELLSEIFDN